MLWTCLEKAGLNHIRSFKEIIEASKMAQEVAEKRSMNMERQSEVATSSYSCWNKWLAFAAAFNRGLENFFKQYGYFITRYPFVVMMTCLILAGSLGFGFTLMEIESRNEKLYVPQDSRASRDVASADRLFKVKSRFIRVILLNKNKGTVLKAETFKSGFGVFQGILNNTKIERVCIKVNNTGQPFVLAKTAKCLRRDPFQLFNYSTNEIAKGNITTKINKLLQNQGYLMTNFRPLSVNIHSILGKVRMDSTGNITYAEAISFDIFITYPENDDQYKDILSWEGKFIKYMENVKKENSKNGLDIFYFAYKSIDDSVNESGTGDVILISITFTLICTFACLALGRFQNKVTGHALAGMVGLFAVLMGIGSGFGLVILCRVKFVSIVGILPFLILGVAIDDMFIILDELDRKDFNLETRELLATVLSKVGGTVTMTTVTDLVAFTVTSMSAFPAIRIFCTYAAVGITFSYLMIMTFFIAFLVYEVNRIKQGRYDMVPFIKSTTFTIDKEGGLICDAKKQISSVIMTGIGNILMIGYVRIIVMILSVAFLAACVVGAMGIKETFKLQMLGLDGSEFVKYLDAKAVYFPTPVKISIVVPGTYQLTSSQNQAEYAKLSSIAIASSKHMQKGKLDWFDAFKTWSCQNRRKITGNDFMQSLQIFLSIAGNAQYAADLKFSEDRRSLLATRVIVYLTDSEDSSIMKDGMVKLRDAIDKQSTIKPYIAAMQFIFAEQYVLVKPEATRDVIVCGITVVIMTAPFLLHPGILILMVFNFTAFIIELLGLMSIWNVSLNSISLVLLTLAIGFALDYSAHIVHAYIASTERRSDKRFIDALATTGASVCMGGFSTFLGVLLTAFASSEVFRIFFKMFFGIVVLGLLHGLVILPTFIEAFGIKAVARPEPIEEDAVLETNPNADEEVKKPNSIAKGASFESIEIKGEKEAHATQPEPITVETSFENNAKIDRQAHVIRNNATA